MMHGKLTMDARTTDPAAPAAAREKPVLSFRRRRYSIENGVLTLSSIDDRDRITAISTWRKQ